ncbi:MAG: class I SAM-dependent methyltransferase [Candidatus Dojkabacteria bacterium]|jgi:SAM-dependent methyltransferase|nr:class I SAM-dependent methyltransferase [Candidatus Dojkabacteria bacterium]MDD4561433.1 class I SAM-dependent methyltransferase [Candidatus Dojkabacteria bacterium]
MSDIKVKTVEYYDNEANTWSASHGGDDDESWWKDEMIRFKEYLPNGKVIEIGSGVGKDAQALISLGYDYVGTDASIGLLELARQRNPLALFVKKYIHELDSSLGEFDGFWASAVLLHIPRDEMINSLLVISSVLKKDGIGFITMKEGEGEQIDEKTGRLFTYYKEHEFRDVLESTGFFVLEVKKRDTEKDNWLIFYVKKTE